MKRSIVSRYFFIVTFNTFLYEDVNKIYFNVPPDTKHVNFISPPSSYGPATVDTVFPRSSMMFGLCGGTEKENRKITTLQINSSRVYYYETFWKTFSLRTVYKYTRGKPSRIYLFTTYWRTDGLKEAIVPSFLRPVRSQTPTGHCDAKISPIRERKWQYFVPPEDSR